MDYQEGYVYHIKDEYFAKVKDPCSGSSLSAVESKSSRQ